MITTALLIGSGAATAQGGGTAQFGALGGTHAGNALACGATAAQADKLRASHKAQAKTIFGSEAGFDRTYDTAEAQTQKKITDAWKKGQYKPSTEVCSELMRQVRS
ncbi:hypothetical protein [Stenotrophomonas sp. AN71]|uniref:hypothetical protein n=1 Tax=Stenotrophomonas sp. AN71 TaxID=3156253 RepID=UPI003D200022